MTEAPSKPLSYKDAGVDIDAGNALVKAIKPAAASTNRSGVMGGIGGFGGLFDLKAAGFKDPILVASTDGVGTKVKIAIEANKPDGIGVDLVAMCVNDLVVQGAEPLFFLDYYATGKLRVGVGAKIVQSVAEGCRQANCALIGGETAEMPGLYSGDDYDLAGFSVGAAERGALLPAGVREGDVVLGLASTGVHSNGYSLVRKIVEKSGLKWSDPAPFAEKKSLGEALLTPTRIYVRSCLAAIRAGGVHALAHITGGGITENLPRCLPDGLGAEVDLSAWSRPAVFDWLQQTGGVADDEMLRAFNCGVGMAVIVAADKADALAALLTAEGETVARIGRVVKGEGVRYAAPKQPKADKRGFFSRLFGA